MRKLVIEHADNELVRQVMPEMHMLHSDCGSRRLCARCSETNDADEPESSSALDSLGEPSTT